mmetsp:Transcript_10555/g.39267  ORF Transcript_10555/g.39267 Transcript_10555/m.39267 type:complete len:1335 (-) Transcript_10555:184-4188(-)
MMSSSLPHNATPSPSHYHRPSITTSISPPPSSTRSSLSSVAVSRPSIIISDKEEDSDKDKDAIVVVTASAPRNGEARVAQRDQDFLLLEGELESEMLLDDEGLHRHMNSSRPSSSQRRHQQQQHLRHMNTHTVSPLVHDRSEIETNGDVNDNASLYDDFEALDNVFPTSPSPPPQFHTHRRFQTTLTHSMSSPASTYLPSHLLTEFSHEFSQFHELYAHYFSEEPEENVDQIRGVVMDESINFEPPSLDFLNEYTKVSVVREQSKDFQSVEKSSSMEAGCEDYISIPDDEHDTHIQSQSLSRIDSTSSSQPSPPQDDSFYIMQQCAHLFLSNQFDILLNYIKQENLLPAEFATHSHTSPLPATHIRQLYILSTCCHLHYCGSQLWTLSPHNETYSDLMHTLSKWKKHLPEDLLPKYWLADIYERRGQIDEALNEILWIYNVLKVVNRYVCVKCIWLLEVMIEREKRAGAAQDTTKTINALQQKLQKFYQELILLNFKNGGFLYRRWERMNIVYRLVFDTRLYSADTIPIFSDPTHALHELLTFYSQTLLHKYPKEFCLYMEYVAVIQRIQFTTEQKMPDCPTPLSTADHLFLHTQIIRAYLQLIHASGKKTAYEDLVNLLKYTTGQASEDTPTVNQDPTQATSALSRSTMHVHTMFVQLYPYLHSLHEWNSEFYCDLSNTFNEQTAVESSTPLQIPTREEDILDEWLLALRLHGEYVKQDALEGGDHNVADSHTSLRKRQVTQSPRSAKREGSSRDSLVERERRDSFASSVLSHRSSTLSRASSTCSMSSLMTTNTELMPIPYATNSYVVTTHSTYIASSQYHTLAQILVLKGRINDAIAVYTLMTQSVPLQFNLHLMDHVRLLEEDTREEELILLFKSVLDSPPNVLPEEQRTTFRYSLALVLDSVKRYDEALCLYQELSKSHPHHYTYGVLYADALVKRKRFSEARASLIDQVKRHAPCEVALQRMHYLLQSRVIPMGDALDKQVTHALVQCDSQDADYCFAHGEALLNVGKNEEGFYYLERAIRLDGKRVEDARKRVGKDKNRRTKLRPRIRSRVQISRNPNPPKSAQNPQIPSFYTRASLAFYLKNRRYYNESIILFKKMIRDDPERHDNYANLANVFLECGRVDEGLEVYRMIKKMTAQSNSESSISAHLSYANFLKVYKRYSKALKEYESLLKQHPNHIIALQQCASLLHKMRDNSKEIFLWKRVLQVDPENKCALIAVGKDFVYRGQDPVSALTLLEQAVDLYPSSHQAHKHLGVCYNMISRNEDAVKHLHRSIQLKSSYGAAHFALGLIFQEEERFEEAKGEFRHSIELGYKVDECLACISGVQTS